MNGKRLAGFAIVVLAVVLVNVYVVSFGRVSGISMEPTLKDGEWILIKKFAYHYKSPQPGDIVMIERKAQQEQLVKRVVAAEGDEIWSEFGKLHLNGQLQTEGYVRERMIGEVASTIVPKGYVYVLGDNRNKSEDSRNFGLVPLREIKGRIEK